jgi:hypothetical protein
MTASSAPLPEVRPAQAPPDIAALYERIRAAGFPQVNLVYRHLATIPGALAWTWDVLEPHYFSGRIDDETGRLARANLPVAGEPIWDVLPAAAARELRSVLVSYNEANARNLIALTALADAVRRGVPRRVRDGETAALVPRPVAAIPLLPTLAQLAEEVRALVRTLAALHPEHAAGVIPSLYLHLALWPDALRSAHSRLSELVGSEVWHQQKAALMNAVRPAASRLAAELDADAPLPAAVQNQILTALDPFVTGTIPDMVLVGAVLCGGARASNRYA